LATSRTKLRKSFLVQNSTVSNMCCFLPLPRTLKALLQRRKGNCETLASHSNQNTNCKSYLHEDYYPGEIRIEPQVSKSQQKTNTSLLAMLIDKTKELMSYPKCRSVEVINNPVRLGLNHREMNYINYK